MRDVTLYLKDILQSMEAVEMFVEGMDFDWFSEYEKTKSAVFRAV